MGFGFHKTALLGLALLALPFISINKKSLAIIGSGSILASVLFPRIIKIASSILDFGYGGYLDNFKLNLTLQTILSAIIYVLLFVIVIIAFYKTKVVKHKETRVFVWGLLLTLVLRIIGDIWFVEAHRLALYFEVMTWICFISIIGDVVVLRKHANILVCVGLVVYQCVTLLQGSYGFLSFNLIA